MRKQISPTLSAQLDQCQGIRGTTNPCNQLRRVKVISQDDWKKLNAKIQGDDAETIRLEERRLANEKLKQTSQEMVKHWTNTFLGARQKKLDERAKRLADEEAARVAIDIEEAKFQAAQRKAAIEEAKLKMYYQTDRVKHFHSALLLSETLKERDAQLELKELCNKTRTDKEKILVEQWRRELAEAERQDREKAAAQRAKNVQIASELKEQMKEHTEAKKREEEEKLADRQYLLQLAAEDAAERERLAQMEREQGLDLKTDYQQQIEQNKKNKEIERLKEEEEDEKCRIFAAAKRKMIKMRVLKERELFKAREEQMDRISKFLSEQLTSQEKDEEQRTERSKLEKEEAERLREAEKAKKLAEQLAEITAHRLDTIKRHREEQEQAKLAELDEVRKHNEAVRAITEYENTCREEKSARLKALSKEYMEQKKQREDNKKLERETEIQLVGAGNKLAQREEEIFQDYTKRVIEHCATNGRNVYPLKAAARPDPRFGLISSLPDSANVVKFGEHNSS